MILTVTHSARQRNFSESTTAMLKERFWHSDRLKLLPGFETLNNGKSPKWKTNLTLWSLKKDYSIEFLSCKKSEYTVYHGIVHHNMIILCTQDALEFYNEEYTLLEKYTHNWFAGGHTVFAHHDKLYISCCASDAVLIFDLTTRLFVDEIRIPSGLYGANYDLQKNMNVKDHYIHNDIQLTHMNYAFPFNDLVLITAFIPGSVILLHTDNTFQELTTGYIGCHGAKPHPEHDGFYFADTCRGRFIEMNWKGEIQNELFTDSKWLHDCQWIEDDIYMFSVSDRNSLEIWDIREKKLIQRYSMDVFGETTLYLALI